MSANTLHEAESKQLLRTFGIPVVPEMVAGDADAAVAAAKKLGFPVVVKALGKKLAHKSDRGLVRLGVSSEAAVREAARYLTQAAGADLEGLLVQPQLSGRRELVAGMVRDPRFGPVIMFG